MSHHQRQLLKHYLANVQLDLSIAALTKVNMDWQHFDFLAETNSFYFIVSGEGYVKIKQQEFSPRPGQLLLLPENAMTSFSTISHDTYLKYWCSFNATVGDINFLQLFELPYCIDVQDTVRATHLFEQLIHHYNSDQITSIMQVKAALLGILAYFIESSLVDKLNITNAPAISKINLVVDYIENHLCEELSVKSLASILHFHPNYFIAIFKTYTGFSPMHYIQKTRLEKAKHYLTATDRNISEVAGSVGMQLFSFSKAFKSYTGYSPTHFRDMIQAGCEAKF